jgi:hypothetical protein
VQFVCNLGGNYGQYGRSGRFFLLFVDNIDSVDAWIRHGQSSYLTVDQDVAGLPLWGTGNPRQPPSFSQLEYIVGFPFGVQATPVSHP